MLKLPVLLVCLIAFFFSSSAVSAAPIQPVAGLEALRKTFAGVNDFTAEISQQKHLKLMKRVINMNGTVRFRNPDLFLIEINAPYASRTLLKDSTVEQVVGNKGDRNRIVLPPEQGLKHWFSKMNSTVKTVPEGVDVKADLTAGLYTVTISPNNKGQIKELVISFMADGLIKRLVIGEQNGDKAVMTFKKIHINSGLTEKDFML